MKKINVMLLALAALLLFSCEDKKKMQQDQQKSDVEVVPLHEMPGICEAHGTVGDGSSMNVIEFINDDGDTLYISKNGQDVMGGLIVGDELDVIYNVTKEDVFASVGGAATYNMSVDYDSWEVKNGLLLLHSPRKIGSETPAIVDTFEIMQLTTDSLVLMNGDLVTEFGRYN